MDRAGLITLEQARAAGLYIHGGVGANKTYAASSMARLFVEAGYEVAFTTAKGMLERVKATFDEGGTEAAVARRPRKKRRYSSYMGEISEAPANTCLDGRGRHHFRAEAPNELWVTDITEFRIPSGRCYLSPVIDCFDGMPIGWSIGTSPSADLADSSLREACAQLREGDRPRVHTDRGGHYRWPGWVSICAEHGLVRSMSRKGRSPDNARAEGFFGRLKVEFFQGRSWDGVAMDEFMEMLDRYMAWYRDVRRKSDLGYMSPARYRASIGLAA